jgi:hypothetical protein
MLSPLQSKKYRLVVDLAISVKAEHDQLFLNDL